LPTEASLASSRPTGHERWMNWKACADPQPPEPHDPGGRQIPYLTYSRGSVTLPFRALAATVIGLAR
jgi:hypothetical protein